MRRDYTWATSKLAPDMHSNVRPSLAATRQDRWRDCLIAAIVGLLPLAVYFQTLAPDVLDGDSGELAYAPYSLGLPHPTGYPLYVLLGRLWAFLPIGNLAYRMNLLSAVFAAGTIIGLYFLVRRIGVPQFPAVAASLALAFSPLFWSQSTIAEVYTLHTLIIVAVLSLAVATRDADGLRQYQLLQATAFAYGLGLAHHRTILLLAPGLVIYLWPTLARLLRMPRQVAYLSGFLALPLLLYLYIPLRAPQLGLDGSIKWALGASFSENLKHQTISDIVWQLPSLGESALTQFTAAGALVIVIGLVTARSRQRPLLLPSCLTGLAAASFYLSYDVPDVEVFLLTAYVVAAIWLAIGFHSIQAALDRLHPATLPLALALALAMPAGLLLGNYSRMDLSGRYEISRYWNDLLQQPLEYGSAIVGDGGRLAPIVYHQVSAGVRTDLTVIGARLDQAEGWSKLESWLADGRTAYVLDPPSRAPARYQFARLDPVTAIRAAQPDEATPRSAPVEPLEFDGLRLLGYSLEQSKVRAGDTVIVDIFWVSTSAPAHDYSTYVHLIDRIDGRMVTQLDKGALDYTHYGYPVTRWPAGEVIRDRFALSIPADLQIGSYQLEAGMYLLQEGEVALTRRAHLGHLVVASSETVPDAGQAPVVTLGGVLTLRDAQLTSTNTLAAGQEITIMLRWQARRRTNDDYIIFAHLGRATSPPIAQLDSHPLGGRYPTSLWDEGEIVLDERRLFVPNYTLPGEYNLYVGAYTARDRRRLLTPNGDDRIDLGTIVVR